jgi:sn-glycerol 3-phosphate transport system substrate-binding protein
VAACSSGESALTSGEGGDDTKPPDTPVIEPEPSDPVEVGDETDSTDGGEPAETEPATTEPAPTTTEAPLAEYPPCPVDALDEADGTVEIQFWHGLADERETALEERADAYNASQDKVQVKLQNQTSYDNAIDKYIQLGGKNRPELIQFPEYAVQPMAESGTFIPVEACIEASAMDMSPYLPRSLVTYQFEGIQWSMPFNISTPVLYYNRNMFEASGLDPDDPPLTLEELRATSQTLVDSGAAGFGLVLDTGRDSGGGWYVEQWFGRIYEPYADNGNGRLAPATEVLFDSPAGVEMMTFLQEMINDGLAVNVGDNPGGQDSFLKMIDQTAPGAMTMGTSGAIGSVIDALGAGLGQGMGLTADDIGIGYMPGPSDEASAQLGGASLWIPADKGDAQAAAAWDFVQFLSTAESQSIWSAATGYVPTRDDAIALEPLKSTYADDPRFAVAYEQLLARADDPLANAPVLGPQREVRSETAKATAAIFKGADVQSELTKAVERSNALIDSYNRRN